MNAHAGSTLSASERSDAVFKTFVEAALLIALSVAHLAVELPTGILVSAMVVLMALSLASDAYLFGSIKRAFAARRALHFKVSPFLVAGVILFFILPIENEGDKIVRFALAAGLGGIATGFLNLSARR